MLRTSLAEYLAIKYFDENLKKYQHIPDLSTECWREYFRLLTQHKLYSILDTKIYLIEDGSLTGLGLQKPSVYDAYSPLEIPFTHQSCHNYFPYSLSAIIDGIPELLELSMVINHPISLETITPIGGYTNIKHNDKYFLWLNSPVCRLDGDYDQILGSLNRKRRYKIKEAQKQHSDKAIITSDILTNEELCWTRDILSTKYSGHEFDYAYSQVLWAQAISSSSLKQTVWFKIYDNTKLLCVAAFIIRPGEYGNTALFHCNIQNCYDNLGAFLLGSAVQYFSKPEVNVNCIDPTCKTSLDTSSIDTYKRLIINTDAELPLFFISYKPMEAEPPYYNSTHWVLSESIVIKGPSL